MTKQEKVAAFMLSLGFVKGKYYYTQKDTDMDISEEEATFFYDVVEGVKIQAEANAKLDYEKHIYNNMVAHQGDSLISFMYNHAPEPYYFKRLRHLKQEGKINE
jgi:hypothetical protein